ncbi:Aromatic peroxygenase [Fusarium mundagurra]|uniref:Aromatic peroxygenase n=1 Tax=Fusarium mundagurra TaxID=1567541 RepID=A0A8H5Y6C4_9HYPO|nr:Aromatic peroxygenase [Fusarium mundagurra]
MSAEQLKTYQEHAKRSPAACPYSQEQKRATGECPFVKAKRAAKFDSKKQRISVSGEHEFLPPNLKAGDERGPCPGLNALANHGYRPGNGVADMQTIIKATNEVYGMSLDLGGFLAVYGTVFNGNPVSLNPGYSIGGPSRFSQNIFHGGGILGTPSGLSGSHNKYESDVSATRGGLYSAIPENTPAPEQYSALAPFHYKSFQDSEKTNSNLFYSPFAGILYRRPVEDEFSIPDFLIDVLEHAAKYPRLFNIGNTIGKVNSFSVVDIGDLTGGVFNTAMLLQGDNLECFVMQIIMAAAPDVLGSQFTNVTKALTTLADKLRQLLAGETCPKLQKVNMKLFEKFPGCTEPYGSYAGVSKGPLRGVIEGVGGILRWLLTTGNKA